jgi:hypothetical protein
MPNHRPQGRKARAEPSSRMGQFYDSEIEPIFDTTFGKLTKRGFMSKLNKCDSKTKFSTVLIKLTDSKFSRKSCVCGGKIQILGDGRAVCNNPHCSTIFNDGGNTEGMLKITENYDSGKKEEFVVRVAWVPRKGEHGHSHLNKFIKACRA